MKANQYPRKSKFLAFLLSTLMLSSTALGFSACKGGNDSSSDDSSSDDTTTEEYVDTNDFKNAGFENFDDNNGLSPIATSPLNWSLGRDSDGSGTANASNSASGIVDTKTAKWDSLTTSKVENPYSYTEAQIAEKWKDMSTRDKLEYYRDWKADDDNDNRKITELSFYETFNIDDEDIPMYKNDENAWVGVANPRTHDYTTDSETDEDYDSKVLMLHNNLDKTNYIGTANKATSESKITIKAGTSAKLSVWVKTAHLKGNLPEGSNSTALVDLGAYIQISHSVGSATMDPIEVKNINTEGVTENNGWVQYEFYLKGSYYVDSTFNVVFGLGHGGSQDKLEYVNGYAFFDDVQYEIIENSEYTTLSAGAHTELVISADKNNRIFEADELNANKMAMNFYGLDTDFSAHGLLDTTGWEIAPTTEKNVSGTRYTAVEQSDIFLFPSLAGATTYAGLGIDASSDRYEIADSVQVLNGGNAYEQAVYNRTFKDKTFLTNEKALILFSANGVNYTAKSPAFPVPAGERRLISFFVKTSEMNGATGATITLNDGDNKTAFSAIDTTTVVATAVGEKEIYDGWQQYLFFLYNETDTTQNVSLTFNYGSTTVIGTTSDAYREGFAVFSGFKTKSLSKQEFTFGGNSSRAKVITLSGKDNSVGAGDSGFDTATNLQSANIKNGFALPQNYTGVYSDSVYLNSKNTSFETNGNKANAGLLNKEYADNYGEIFTKLGATGTTGAEKWTSVFPYATQPLVIYNDDSAERTKSYGFVGPTTTVNANSYKAVSLYVKTTPGATAAIYLADMSDDTRTSFLSIGRNRIYWYDKNGNVCDMDPNGNDFDKNKNVAFNLQSNGLYTVDETWTKKGAIETTKYFANLANYEVDEDGNLLIAKDGVSYDYSDLWQHEGNDGIAFYGYDATTKTAYADKAKTILVYDFSTVTDLPARHEAREATASNYFELDTNGALVEVNFFIHTGTEAKTYRLEVWSGTRDGQTVNPANSYVYFDINGWTIDATKFENNTTKYKDDYKQANNAEMQEGENYFENTFSFYDSAKYLRYNEGLDENKVGNKYTDYDATDATAYATHKTAVAYMRYENATEKRYEIYTDYALNDTVVSVDVQEDDSNDSNDTDVNTNEALNPMLLISSIAVSAVLIVAIALIIIRKSVSSYRKKHGIYKK